MHIVTHRQPAIRLLVRHHRFFATNKAHRAQHRPPPTPQYSNRSPPLPTPPTPKPSSAAAQELQAQAVDLDDARFGARDPVRGREATLKVAQGGKLDARYRPAARRILAIIVALPFVITLSYELYQRRFRGKERKRAEG